MSANFNTANGHSLARVVTLDRVLAVVTLYWLLRVTFFTDLWAPLTVTDFWVTIVLLVVDAVVGLVVLTAWKRNAVLLNVAQILAFGVLHWQVYHVWGPQHYKTDREPTVVDWAMFTGAHVLRAADVLDVIEDYQIDVQTIKHSGRPTGAAIVAMHLTVDIFLLGLVIRGVKRAMRKYKERPKDRRAQPPTAEEDAEQVERVKRVTRRLKRAKLICLGVTVCVYVAVAVAEEWSRWNWVVWPLETVLRLLDVCDILNTFNLKFHTLPQSFWLSTLAVSLRLFAGLYVAEWVSLWHLKSLGGAMRTTDELVEDLKSPNPVVREVAAVLIGQRGEAASSAAPALVEALADLSALVRYHALRSLTHIGGLSESAVPALERLLGDADEDVRLVAAESLGELRGLAESALPVLVAALSDPDPDVRRAAVQALGKIGRGEAAAVLETVVIDDDVRMRWAALGALGDLGSKAAPAFDTVIRLIGDDGEDDRVRQLAVKTTGELDEAAAIPFLVSLLDRRFSDQAKWALRLIGRRALPALVAVLNDGYTELRILAAEILGEMWEPAAAPHLAKLLADGDSRLWPVAVAALANVGREVVPAVISLLGDKHPARGRAAKVVVKLGPDARAAIPALVKLLGDDNAEVREDVARALVAVGGTAIQAVIDRLSDDAPRVRADAAEVLGVFGRAAAAAIPDLEKLLTDYDASVRLAATHALGEMKRELEPEEPEKAVLLFR